MRKRVWGCTVNEGLVHAWLGEGLFERTWLLSNARKMCANARWQLEDKAGQEHAC
jgi:hypothetical protein